MEPPAAARARPFAVLLGRAEEAGGRFRPEASVALTPALRASGFLDAVPGDALKDLLLLLTFAGPEGDVLPTLPLLAGAMGLPQGLARSRMRRLTRAAWRGRPLVREIRRESGLDAFAPSPHLLDVRQAVPPLPAFSAEPVVRAAGREAVVSLAREAYARPRAVVEEEMARLNGWDRPETEEDTSPDGQERAALRKRLLATGVSRAQADLLLAQFARDAIARQLDWLPYRGARDPARFLVAALSGDYEPPSAFRRAASSPDPPPDAHLPATT